MLKAPENIYTIIRKPVEALGYELVGVETFHTTNRIVLRVYIDQPTGITLDDCSTVSHQLSGILDVTNVLTEQYNLEVSSPGLDRPLFELDHFKRFQGYKIRMVLTTPVQGRRKLNGILLEVIGDQIKIQDGDTIHHIPFGLMKTARLVPDF